MISAVLAILASASLQGADSPATSPSSLAQVSQTASAFKDTLQRLSQEKEQLSATSSSQADRMRMLEEMQVKGAQSAQNERQFIRDARAKLEKANAKLESLEAVQNPDKASLLELAKARQQIKTVNAELAMHFLKFSKEFPKP